MSEEANKGKRPIRLMAILLACLVIGAVVLIVLWMRNPPPGVEPAAQKAGPKAATSYVCRPLQNRPWT